MKRFVIIAVLLVSGILTASAQLFVGGGLNVGFTGGKFDNGTVEYDKSSSFTFGLSPKVGYYLTEVIAVGAKFSFYTNSTTYFKGSPFYTEDTKHSDTNWSFGVFGRYGLIGNDNLLLSLEGGPSYGISSSKTKTGDADPVKSKITTNTIDFVVYPVLNYRLSDLLSVEATCNFLGLGYVLASQKDEDNSDLKNTTSGFALGLNNTSAVSVGLLFKF